MWHYFVNDIYFIESGEDTLTPYIVTINIKENNNGEFVYSYNAEKESHHPTDFTCRRKHL